MYMDFNEGLELFRKTPGAVLLDVRSPEEYAGQHIEGSTNVPVQELPKVLEMVPDKSTPFFVHCLSGGRSSVACNFLKRIGYTNVTNIGGLSEYEPD